MTARAPALLVLQHVTCEPPAAYEDELLAWGARLHRIQLDEGEPLPDWRAFAGIVATGGPVGAYEDDRLSWLAAEKKLIADAVRAGTPYWGSSTSWGSRPRVAARRARARDRWLGASPILLRGSNAVASTT